jgi:hypothetical protein
MVKIETRMTKEDLENNYEYKVVRRALMREFPWIKDVTFDPEELDTYNLIFLRLIVDPIEMGEQYGWEMNRWVTDAWSKGQRYSANYPSLLFNITHEVGKDNVTNPLINMLEQIHSSPALPEEMKLPKGRQFTVGSFIVNPDGEPW